jgi:hypothetical protein
MNKATAFALVLAGLPALPTIANGTPRTDLPSCRLAGACTAEAECIGIAPTFAASFGIVSDGDRYFFVHDQGTREEVGYFKSLEVAQQVVHSLFETRDFETVLVRNDRYSDVGPQFDVYQVLMFAPPRLAESFVTILCPEGGFY